MYLRVGESEKKGKAPEGSFFILGTQRYLSRCRSASLYADRELDPATLLPLGYPAAPAFTRTRLFMILWLGKTT